MKEIGSCILLRLIFNQLICAVDADMMLEAGSGDEGTRRDWVFFFPHNLLLIPSQSDVNTFFKRNN